MIVVFGRKRIHADESVYGKTSTESPKWPAGFGEERTGCVMPNPAWPELGIVSTENRGSKEGGGKHVFMTIGTEDITGKGLTRRASCGPDDEHSVGLSRVDSYCVKTIDFDYFEEA